MDLFELKSDEIELPSKGYAYDKSEDGKSGIDLINGSYVKVRPFLVSEGYTLSNLNGGDTYSVFRTLLSKVVVEPKNLNFDELLLSDVLFIAFYARLMTFGPKYPVQMECQSCGERQHQKIMLNELQVRMADEFEEGYKPDNLEIDLSGIKLTLHLDRMKDSKLVKQDVQDMKRRGKVSNEDVTSRYLRWARLIDLVNGEEVIVPKKFEMIMNFSMPDFEKLNEFLNEHQTGLIPELFIACTRCGYENSARVEIGPDFFRTVK